jgi:hypothetical protein
MLSRDNLPASSHHLIHVSALLATLEPKIPELAQHRPRTPLLLPMQLALAPTLMQLLTSTPAHRLSTTQSLPSTTAHYQPSLYKPPTPVAPTKALFDQLSPAQDPRNQQLWQILSNGYLDNEKKQ